MIKQHKKYLSENITYGLKFSEFDCHCENKECITLLITDRLKRAYELFRHLVKMPLHPTSGYRCVMHNFSIGSDLSCHKIGEAIDISSINLLDKLSLADILFFAKLSGFTYYIYYKSRNIFHFDVREHGGNL